MPDSRLSILTASTTQRSLSKIGKRGDELVAMIARAHKHKRTSRVAKYLRTVGKELVGYKIGQKYTKDMIGKVIEAIATSQHNAQATNDQPPSIINYMGPGPYDVSRTGQKFYK